MGGAVASSSTDYTAAYYNPAGLVGASQPKFALGYQHGLAALTINGEPHAFEPVTGLTLGLGLPLPFGGFLEEKLALGLVFVIPEAAVLAAQTPAPPTPHFPLLDSRAQSVTLVASLGYRISSNLSIGAGLAVLAHLEGRVDAEPDSTGQIGARVRDTLLTDLAPLIGIRYSAGDFPISFTYRTASRATYALPVEADLGDQIPLALPTLNIRGTAQFDPSQISLELGWHLSPGLLLSFGIAHELWSDFENPIEFVATPESYPQQPTPNFKDTWSFRMGLEGHFEVSSLKLIPRMGISFVPSPAPLQVGYHNYLDNDRLLICGGIGTQVYGLEIGLAFQLQHLLQRSFSKDPALTSAFDDYAYPGDFEHTGTLYFTTLDVSMEF